MAERHQGNRRGSRRRGLRPWSSTGIGPRALTVIVVALALALLVAPAASGQPQRSSGSSAGHPRWILFTAQTSGPGAQQIFRISPSGKGLKQLTKGAYSAGAPAFSPDGKRIAFARLGAGIFSMNVDGSGLRALTTNGRDSFPAWSPDGKQIAFIRPLASGWKVLVMSASGARARLLAQSPPAGRPSWTRQGLLIPTNGDLAKIDPRSGHVQKLFGALIDASVGMDSTAVSPDLSTITFVGALPPAPGDTGCGEGVPCPRFALSVQDLRTHKAPRIIVPNGGPASFSPDGKRLAFVAQNRLVLRTLANGTSTSIKTGKLSLTTSTPPVWQPPR
jgi:Tol biopolymer transport system component